MASLHHHATRRHTLNINARRFVRPLALAALVALALPLSACAGGSDGGSVGYNKFTHTVASGMAALCKDFLGDAKTVGEHVGATTYDAETANAAGGSCTYSTNTGGQLAITISDKKPTSATLFAVGKKYVAVLTMNEKAGVETIPAGKREDVTKWLEGRANAVTDDFDAWVGALPAAPAGYSATDFNVDPASTPDTKALTGLLRTPDGTVTISKASTPRFLYIDKGYAVPAKDEKFITSTVAAIRNIDAGAASTYAVTYDGADAGTNATAAVQALVAGTTNQIALSVPAGAKDVNLTVTTGDVTQSISLLTGTVTDNGESDRLIASIKGTTKDGSYDGPVVTRPDGSVQALAYSPDFAKYADWYLTAWDAADGWAPKGQNILIVRVQGLTENAAAPLTVQDATVTIDGKIYPANSFASNYYHFLIPDGAAKITATLHTAIRTDLLKTGMDIYGNRPEWGAGYTITPGINTWVIDPTNVTAAK